MTSSEFGYAQAFARNIGWVTTDEQQILRTKRVAIAGLGGVGGAHLLTLTRLGIGAFHIADHDVFELANFNRQAGASLSTLGQSKAGVLAHMARDINPELALEPFPQGIDGENVEAFLNDVDVYVDGLDYFAVGARRLVFEACHRLGIPAITAAPLGMGAALLNFLPGGMSFEQYARLDGHPEDEQLVRFLLGLSPAMLQRGYLVDPTAVDFAHHRGPSTPMACELCAGIAATEALKILLNRGRVLAAPRGLQFDAYRNRLVRTWRPWGNRNPLQRVALAVARRQLRRMGRTGAEPSAALAEGSAMEQILDLARWAPSGDNSQPWRFEIVGETELVIHGRDTREECIYDLQGHASQISLGALIETLRIAATAHGHRLDGLRRRPDSPDTAPQFDVRFAPDPEANLDPLAPYIRRRTVQRRPLATRPLTGREHEALETSVGSGYRIHWVEGLGQRLRMARLLFDNGGLRLALPEAYAVHRDVIEWNARESATRIPDRAVGLDPLTRRLTRWAMGSWGRMDFLNRYLGGSLVPRLELDFLPGLGCAAHWLILADTPPRTLDDYVAAGRAVQRFWLAATRLGLYVQPEVTPLVFHEYVRDEVPFTRVTSLEQRARRISRRLGNLVGPEPLDRAVFMGRIGAGKPPNARSTRRPLEELIVGEETVR